MKNKKPLAICWICSDCALKLDGSMPKGHICTFHNGTCSVCKNNTAVTQPRDYRLNIDGTPRKQPTLRDLYLWEAYGKI